jgi:predicted MPP superfamily phosphohydrolase
VAGLLNIVGVDDPAAKRFGIDTNPSEAEILGKFSDDKLTILLKHRPMISEKSKGLFDLQLSGHLHKGQVFPFSLITSLLFPYHNGLFKLEGHSYIYVSRGTGTWGPPVRFLSPPEITVIEFQRTE